VGIVAELLLKNLHNSFGQPQNATSVQLNVMGIDVASEQQLATRVISYIASFDKAPPFTVQRIAELILFPSRYHSSQVKYLRALDRTLMVIHTLL
jgi:PPP4R2